MNKSHFYLGIIRKALVISVLFSFVGAFAGAGSASATSLSDLQKQKAALEQQAAQAIQQADANKTLAQRAADRLQQVGGQITDLQSSIQDTQSGINDTGTQINQQNQQLAQLESQLRTTQDQEDALIRQLYISEASQPDTLSFFTNQPVSDRERQATQLSDLKKAAEELADKTKAAQAIVQTQIDSLNQHQRALQAQKDQQTQQQQSLADIQQQQTALRTNAVAAETQLEAQASQAKAQEAKIDSQITALSAVSNWGSQIVSGPEASWYYTQTGDYTQLGHSGYTVAEVGCFITSIAMTATYYGHHITPDYIARNGYFDSEGYYTSGTPAGLGVQLRAGGHINWGVVQSEISAGRPVIVSIYLPSVGAINSDGSSHFIVLYGFDGSHYLMQDPIAPGRSYNLSQVRSMILTSGS